MGALWHTWVVVTVCGVVTCCGLLLLLLHRPTSTKQGWYTPVLSARARPPFDALTPEEWKAVCEHQHAVPPRESHPAKHTKHPLVDVSALALHTMLEKRAQRQRYSTAAAAAAVPAACGINALAWHAAACPCIVAATRSRLQLLWRTSDYTLCMDGAYVPLRNNATLTRTLEHLQHDELGADTKFDTRVRSRHWAASLIVPRHGPPHVVWLSVLRAAPGSMCAVPLHVIQDIRAVPLTSPARTAASNSWSWRSRAPRGTPARARDDAAGHRGRWWWGVGTAATGATFAQFSCASVAAAVPPRTPRPVLLVGCGVHVQLTLWLLAAGTHRDDAHQPQKNWLPLAAEWTVPTPQQHTTHEAAHARCPHLHVHMISAPHARLTTMTAVLPPLWCTQCAPAASLVCLCRDTTCTTPRSCGVLTACSSSSSSSSSDTSRWMGIDTTTWRGSCLVAGGGTPTPLQCTTTTTCIVHVAAPVAAGTPPTYAHRVVVYNNGTGRVHAAGPWWNVTPEAPAQYVSGCALAPHAAAVWLAWSTLDATVFVSRHRAQAHAMHTWRPAPHTNTSTTAVWHALTHPRYHGPPASATCARLVLHADTTPCTALCEHNACVRLLPDVAPHMDALLDCLTRAAPNSSVAVDIVWVGDLTWAAAVTLARAFVHIFARWPDRHVHWRTLGGHMCGDGGLQRGGTPPALWRSVLPWTALDAQHSHWRFPRQACSVARWIAAAHASAAATAPALAVAPALHAPALSQWVVLARWQAGWWRSVAAARAAWNLLPCDLQMATSDVARDVDVPVDWLPWCTRAAAAIVLCGSASEWVAWALADVYPPASPTSASSLCMDDVGAATQELHVVVHAAWSQWHKSVAVQQLAHVVCLTRAPPAHTDGAVAAVANATVAAAACFGRLTQDEHAHTWQNALQTCVPAMRPWLARLPCV